MFTSRLRDWDLERLRITEQWKELAKNEKIAWEPEMTEFLARHEDWQVRAALAGNICLDSFLAKTVDVLSKDVAYGVRLVLASNPRLERFSDAIDNLANDTEADIRNIIANTPAFKRSAQKKLRGL